MRRARNDNEMKIDNKSSNCTADAHLWLLPWIEASAYFGVAFISSISLIWVPHLSTTQHLGSGTPQSLYDCRLWDRWRGNEIRRGFFIYVYGTFEHVIPTLCRLFRAAPNGIISCELISGTQESRIYKHKNYSPTPQTFTMETPEVQ
jgi:hypothetical protein